MLTNPTRRGLAIWLPIILATILATGILLGRFMGLLADAGIPEKNTAYTKVKEVLGFIDKAYVDTVDRTVFTDAMIRQLLESLDPHSQYISTDEFAEMNDPLLGGFEGIGVQFNVFHDTILIVQVIPGGPSEKAGLMAGDRILLVDGDTLVGPSLSNREVVRRLKGPKGTKVTVDVLRRGLTSLLSFTIVRDVIPTYSIDIAYMPLPEIGYMRLSRFSVTTPDEFDKALKALKKEGMSRLILDLRGNSGGYLDAAIALADAFLPKDQLIVYTEGRSRPRKYAYATRRGEFENQPLVILIDEGSASASEILAGAVQDNDRGLIIGRRSFGKGLVQEQFQLPDGSAIRLTVARYYTPTGRSIQRPYDEGREGYFHDFMARLHRGELESADSIPFPDSLKYTTPRGKVVYGGGGITPDIFVGLEQDERYVLFNALVNSGLLYQFAFDHADNQRAQLAKYKTVEEFDAGFRIHDRLFGQLLDHASANGVSATPEEISYARDRTSNLLKAYIARSLFNDAGFYPLYHRQDEIFLRALGVLEEIQDYQEHMMSARLSSGTKGKTTPYPTL